MNYYVYRIRNGVIRSQVAVQAAATPAQAMRLTIEYKDGDLVDTKGPMAREGDLYLVVQGHDVGHLGGSLFTVKDVTPTTRFKATVIN